MIKLSILIPSIETRRNSTLTTLQDEIYGQIEKLSNTQKKNVEVIVLSDNKIMTIGEKRNCLLKMAKGEYIQFIDDDDFISKRFISTLLGAIKSNADVITYHVKVTINKTLKKIAYYSKDYYQDINLDNCFFRIPNQMSCFKREIGLKAYFPKINYGEDVIYSQLILPHLKTEYRIDKVLYFYNFDENLSEAKDFEILCNNSSNNSSNNSLKPLADIIFISKAENRKIRSITQRAINTCLAGANKIPIQIFVLEQEQNITYQNAKTIYLKREFNYNEFANIGAELGSSKWIVIANNDLIFHHNWLKELLNSNHDLVSPHERNDIRQKSIKGNTFGVINGMHFSGWCFMISRMLWKKIKGFDEDFKFWFADDSVIEQVINVGVTPLLVKNSLVDHLGSITLKNLSEEERNELTWELTEKFNKKFNKEKFKNNPYYLKWLESN